MKTLKVMTRWFGVVALALTIGLPSGFAELIQGTIISLNEKAKTLNIQVMDPASGQLKEFKIFVSADAEFEGVSSMKDLKKGDQVVVDASQGETPDVLKANSVELVQA